MKLQLPILIINFKTYKESVGAHADNLARLCEKVQLQTQKSIAIAVTPADVNRISSLVSIPVLSQHMDPDEYGSHTGKILAENLRDNGAVGTLLNHSEDQYRIDVLEKAVDRARETALISVVCANNADIAEAVAAFHPDFIAVEPPELIGGDISVSTARPEVIKETVERVHKIADIPVLCGAGVKTKEDVKRALELGAQGILLASGIVKAEDPEKILFEMVSVL
ncbi:MAG: triose-phosphate isomerase [Nanoarchaeota archaeon]